jgi:hypothetical protein
MGSIGWQIILFRFFLQVGTDGVGVDGDAVGTDEVVDRLVLA